MKRILVPVDFSVAAANALQYALNFGKPFNAEIVCLHATDDVSTHEATGLKLKKFIIKYSDSVGSTVKNVVVNGKLGTAVSEFIDNMNVDMIVMGTKGAAGFQKVFSGSNTTDLLSSTSLPVLIVPQGVSFSPINFILWASDFLELAHAKSLNTLIETALTFNAEVRIAHVKERNKKLHEIKGLEASRMHDVFQFKGVKHSFKNISWTDITGGINYYLKQKGDNNLLVMFRRNRGFLSRIFRLDHTYEFACRPTLPLLIIPE